MEIHCKLNTNSVIFEEEHHSIRVVNCNAEHCRHDKFPVHGTRLHYYALHFVAYGKGTLEYGAEGERVTLGRGDMFLLYKHERYKYAQDINNPWSYLWIEFDGENVDDLFGACGFTKSRPYIQPKQYDSLFPIIQNMVESYGEGVSNEFKKLSGFLQMIGKLIEINKVSNRAMETKQKRRHTFDNTVMYIRNNYRDPLDIPSLSSALALSESYLKHLFPELTGMSATEYINRYRISVSCSILNQHDTPRIAQLAANVGYDDPAYFTRLFRKYKGVSPREYKENCREDDPFGWLKEIGITFDR